MSAPLNGGLDFGLTLTWAKLLIETTLKISIMIGAIALAGFLLRRASASLRSLLWALALAVVLLLPVLACLPSIWSMPLLPDLDPAGAELAGAGLASLPGENLVSPSGAAAGGGSVHSLGNGSVSGLPGRLLRLQLGWADVLCLAWLGGAVLVAVWLLAGQVGGRLLLKRAVGVTDPNWLSLLAEIASESHIRRPVRLLQSNLTNLAMTCGVSRPMVILPADAGQWPEDRRRIVLIHELAHIKRLDCLTESVARAATVLFWFHPLVWTAAHRFRTERERASDDAVLNYGTKPSEYATQLMEVANRLAQSPHPVLQSMTITEGSGLKNRLLSILDPRIRRRAEGPLASGIMLAGLLVGGLPISSLEIWNEPMNSRSAPATSLCTQAELISDKVCQLGSKDVDVRNAAETWFMRVDRAMMDKVVRTALDHEDRRLGMTAIQLLSRRDEFRVTALLKKYASAGGAERKDNISEVLKKSKGAPSMDNQLNTLGYKMLKEGKVDAAIEVFRLNVRTHPESSNTYDSLAEALMTRQDWEAAVANYNKSLELNPDNQNAAAMLAKIGKLRAASGKPPKSR